MVPAVILSGFATPIANMPRLVQAITLINPLRYFVVVLRRVFLEGATATVLVLEYWPMLLIGIISLTAAGWMFRHRLHWRCEPFVRTKSADDILQPMVWFCQRIDAGANGRRPSGPCVCR